MSITSRNTEKHPDNNATTVTNKEQKTKCCFSEKPTKSEKEDHKKTTAPTRSKSPPKNVVNQDLNGETRTENTDQNLDGAPQRPSGNPIVIDKALEQILTGDPTMSEVNLNNIEDISQETLIRFAEALSTNAHVHVFSLANTHADDQVAFALSKMLCKNCSIKILNIESNFVSGQGILALLAALRHNRTLMELRFHNQRHICGGKAEMEMVRLLRENTTLLKLGYQFDLPGPRMTATSILTRNQDQQRQRRLQQKKEQKPPELLEKVSGPKPSAPTRLSKTVEKHNKNVHSSPNPPTRKIAETVKQHEGVKSQSTHGKTKAKKFKNGTNEQESADILKDLKNALKPSLHKRQAEPGHLPPPQRSSRDDLMAAIRGSSVHSLKRVRPVCVWGWRDLVLLQSQHHRL